MDACHRVLPDPYKHIIVSTAWSTGDRRDHQFVPRPYRTPATTHNDARHLSPHVAFVPRLLGQLSLAQDLRDPASPASHVPHVCRGASRHVCTSTVVCGSPRVVHVVAAEGAACRKWRRCRESTRQRGARPTSTWWVYVHVVPWCTGESSCVHTTGVLLGGSGSHAHCPHVCDLQATLTTLSTRTATPAAAQENTRPILSTGPLQPLVGATLIVRRCSA
jgi:hypothetical protein